MFRIFFYFCFIAVSVKGHAAVIAVCESLNAGDPFLSKRIEQDYLQSSELALSDFQKVFPNSKHQLKYCLEAKRPEDILSTQIPPNVATIVGFTFTSGAKVASNFANQNEILFLAPTSALDELFLGSYSMSRGLPIEKSGRLIAQIIDDHRDDGRVLIYSPFDVGYARMMSRAITGHIISPFKQHNYIQVDEETVEIDRSIGKHDIMVFAGYAFQHFRTFVKSLKNVSGVRYFGTNQWAYNQEVLRLILAGKNATDLSVISDFVDAGNDLHALKSPEHLSNVISESATRSKDFAANFAARYKRRPEPFSYAVYDAVFTALLINQKYSDRASMRRSKIDLGWISGVSGPAEIRNGVISRPAYLLKWNVDRLVAQKMFL